MARRKKKSARRKAPRAAKAPDRSPPPPDPTVERLQRLRTLLVAGASTAALSEIDGWLAELGATEPEPEPAAPEPAPADTASPPADPVAAGLLQPLDTPGPRFSVLMAAYNRAHLIAEAIESVLVQPFADYELVIIDDGSTDTTPEVVGRYAADEPRIRYIRKPHNEGRSPTRSRAVAEARGEYILWMADDDLLAPDLLATYDRILREQPHVDVIYGKLQLFEGERDLDIYTPNDWTGRERRLLGAELHGSCIPDGGTATRRALYAKVGAPIYDPEFVRAQDYELWTRLLPHARVRMVDEVVYRYRKHDGGTSWGPFVDLSFDSRIIRRHLSRHPLEALFVGLDWSDPAGARRAAMIQVGRLMLEYQDPHNARRFLAGVAGADTDPDVVEARVRGRLMAGDLLGAGLIIDAFEANWPTPHPLIERLRTWREATETLLTAGRAAIAAGRPSEAEKRAVEHQNRYGLSHPVCLIRGLARDAGGDRREGLWYLAQAARLDVLDTESAERAASLAAELGIDDPKVDIEAMRRRLLTPLQTPLACPVPADGGATISAIVLADGHDRAALERAVRSARRQSRRPLEILVVGARSDEALATHIPAADDPVARRIAGLAAARGDYVAWLTDDSAWGPDHTARLGAALDAGAPAAWGDGHHRDPDTGETTYAPPIGDGRQRLLADPTIPLSALMHRRDVAPEPVAGRHGDWIYALDLAWRRGRDAAFVRIGAPTWVGPAPSAPETTDDARVALEQVFARHPTPLLFAPAARARQAARLKPFGVDWPLRGRTGVVIVGGADRAAIERTLAAVEAHTRCPHGVVVVCDGPGEADRQALIERCAGHTLVATPHPLGQAKAFNMGLARAGGDRVALLRAGVVPPDGWLGRMRWFVADDQQPKGGGVMLALPPPPPGRSDAPVGRPDNRALLVTRSALEAIGGADVTVHGALWLDDWLLRLRRAGHGWRATDVVFEGGVERWATPADEGAAPIFRSRWGGLPIGDRLPDLPDASDASDADADWLRCSYGAEEGFRFDIPPVTVHDGGPDGGRRLLIPDPTALDDGGRRAALLALLGELPADLRVWLRAAPGGGSAALDALAASEPLADVWIVDAPLAPDREGGLFVAADAIYVDGGPDAALHVRRAFDCGHVPLRSPADVRRWARIEATR